MTDLRIPDVSEFQPDVDFSKVPSGAAIARVHNGFRRDNAFTPARLAAMRKSLKVRGFYLYLVPQRAPQQQAQEFAAIVGKLQPGEFAVLDCEDNGLTGDCTSIVGAACAVIDQQCGGKSLVYSYGSWLSAHLPRGLPAGRKLWLAAYQQQEPVLPHVLWQHTDGLAATGGTSDVIPGWPAHDSSIFHGDINALAAIGGLPFPAPAPPKPPTPAPPALKDWDPTPMWPWNRPFVRVAGDPDVWASRTLHGHVQYKAHVPNPTALQEEQGYRQGQGWAADVREIMATDANRVQLGRILVTPYTPLG